MVKKRKQEDQLNKSGFGKEDVDKILSCINNSQQTTISQLNRQIEQVEQNIGGSLKELKDENKQIRALLNQTLDEQSRQRQEVDELIKRVVKLEAEREDLRKDNVELYHRAEESAQYSRANNLKVYGLPEDVENKESASQTLEKVVALVNDKLGVPLKAVDIDIAHRLPSRSGKKTKTRSIIVRLIRRETKSEITKVRKKLKDTSSIR